jgi:maltose O-acetyltransferase
MATEKQKMLAGELYVATGEELAADARRAAEWMERYNASIARTQQNYATLLREKLAEVGEGSCIRPPFHCDYGYNIHLGKGVFLNFNCVILDVVKVTIGDGTQIGPGTQILTADHPRDPEQRRAGLEFGRPVNIGANVWIIGAGAVVTRDVRPGATVVGNPAKERKA